jgi:hypothetical protein
MEMGEKDPTKLARVERGDGVAPARQRGAAHDTWSGIDEIGIIADDDRHGWPGPIGIRVRRTRAEQDDLHARCGRDSARGRRAGGDQE